jgi:hypothetical protein
MNIHAVKDKSGKILSTFVASSNGATIEPVLEDGATVEEMEVPDNYHENPAELYKK